MLDDYKYIRLAYRNEYIAHLYHMPATLFIIDSLLYLQSIFQGLLSLIKQLMRIYTVFNMTWRPDVEQNWGLPCGLKQTLRENIWLWVKVTWKISGVMHQWIMKGNKTRNSNKENLFTLLLFEINLVNLHEGRVDMCLAFEWWNMTINACKRY